MPITQSRMLALIDAAQDYQQAWRKIVNFFNSREQAIGLGQTTHERAWNELYLHIQSTMALERPITTTETIARETEHFRHASKRNKRSAAWQRKKRDQQDGEGQSRPAQPRPTQSTDEDQIQADTVLDLGQPSSGIDKSSVGEFLDSLGESEDQADPANITKL